MEKRRLLLIGATFASVAAVSGVVALGQGNWMNFNNVQTNATVTTRTKTLDNSVEARSISNSVSATSIWLPAGTCDEPNPVAHTQIEVYYNSRWMTHSLGGTAFFKIDTCSLNGYCCFYFGLKNVQSCTFNYTFSSGAGDELQWYVNSQRSLGQRAKADLPKDQSTLTITKDANFAGIDVIYVGFYYRNVTAQANNVFIINSMVVTWAC